MLFRLAALAGRLRRSAHRQASDGPHRLAETVLARVLLCAERHISEAESGEGVGVRRGVAVFLLAHPRSGHGSDRVGMAC